MSCHNITDTTFRIYRINIESGLYAETSREFPTLHEATVAREAENIVRSLAFAKDPERVRETSKWGVERMVGSSCGWHAWKDAVSLPAVTPNEVGAYLTREHGWTREALEKMRLT